MIGVFAGIIGGLAVVIWWAFFSRAAVLERLGAIALIIISLDLTSRFIDKSIATGNMGLMFIIVSVPVMSLAFVAWAAVTRGLATVIRRATMVIIILIASGSWVLFRSDGMSSHLQYDIKWRWAKTEEEKLLKQSANEVMATGALSEAGAVWPGFRGANRDGIIHNMKISTDWKASPPKELWRRPVGPGCSSFAARGELLYTQEQRGDNEVVSCYNTVTGKAVWIHSDKARFWDSHAGAGPRSTPTLDNGRVYTLGATGILNVLDERNGNVVWSLNAAKDAGVKIPGWGYTSSPLLADSSVIVSIAGRIIAYDIADGKLRWSGPDGGESYSSPHLLTIDGVRQILFMSKTSVTSYSPADGRELWKVPITGSPIIQPAQVTESDILIGDPGETGGNGMLLITINNGSDGWKIKKQWTSTGMKPYFNDFIIHKGHAYGFDGLSLACIDIRDGKRLWRGGRYGGQIILLADQDLIIVLTEKGDLALVEAIPDRFSELARVAAIKGKTWNHPVLAGDIMLVRNSQEMAAFRLSLK
jgi:outer membrane protein assembly factor BamB